MENKIQIARFSLHTINDLMEKFLHDESLSLDEQKSLTDSTFSIVETNDIIMYAEEAANDDIDTLYSDTQLLASEVKRFWDIYNSTVYGLTAFDNHKYCEEFLKAEKEAWDKSRAATLALWREYCQLNNRLDLGDCSMEVELLCAKKKTEHDLSKKHTDELYDIYKHKEKYVIRRYYVTTSLMEMVAKRLGDITSNIIIDIDNLRKEGKA